MIADNAREGIEMYEVIGPGVLGNLIEYNGSSGVFASKLSSNSAGFLYNTISGNAGAGIYVFDSYTKLFIAGNDVSSNSGSGLQISVTTHGETNPFPATIVNNSIVHNAGDGIYVAYGVVTVTAQGNQILDNEDNGIEIDYESNALIGGPDPGEANHIADNGGDGIVLQGTYADPSRNDVIEENAIGGSSSSSGNSQAGIWAIYTANLHVSNNLIANNSDAGIDLLDAKSTAASIVDNAFVANGGDGIFVALGSVGVNIVENYVASNSHSGIAIASASQSTVAVEASLRGNGIFDNRDDGIYVSSGQVNVSVVSDTIEDNYADGVDIDNEPDATIGGDCDGMGNSIAFNDGDGIYLGTCWVTAGATVQNDWIAYNGGAGVDITSSNNTIGGTGSYEGNTIAFNDEAGVALGQNSPSQPTT